MLLSKSGKNESTTDERQDIPDPDINKGQKIGTFLNAMQLRDKCPATSGGEIIDIRTGRVG